MTPAIAIVGMACRFPDARTPAELWENVLAQRRAFRRIPDERLRASDYLSPDRAAPDRTYAAEAAVIEGYEFDRVRYRVVGSTFRSADMAHWLALDVAAQALADAGFPDGEGLPRDTTGVLLGNTLTGEFSRASVLRVRWPYVRRLVEAELEREDWPAERRRGFLARLEEDYKRPFPDIGEETLAGGLSNTIAGRICNFFDLHGGGYTVDGACASSLLAIATACSALASGDIDAALAGGVDLSLDPFEIVGFAKTGALAAEEMRVYDIRSAGFWPGEGCGFITLMRYEDAIAEGRRVYALIRGWGVSSDGAGGITRPEVEGQLLAVKRAYGRAGFGAETVSYFEGHGTGTSVGDAAELQTLNRARRHCAGGCGGSGSAACAACAACADVPRAAVGSVKANIGHAKAAAGVAGLLKATMAVHAQVLPPNTGCGRPHPELTSSESTLRALRDGEPWPEGQPLRAGVSAMGFGGINTHVVLEGTGSARRGRLTSRERTLLASARDAELFLLHGPDADSLRARVQSLRGMAARLSRAEMGDLAAALARQIHAGPDSMKLAARAALLASTPAELASRLDEAAARLSRSESARVDADGGVFLGLGDSRPRIGLLFPGQGSPANRDGGAWRRCFQEARALYDNLSLPDGEDRDTAVAQPAIAAASAAALRVLEGLGISGEVAVGHSLGELAALCWAGAYDEEALLRIAAARGRVMAELGSPTGGMASIGAAPEEVEPLLGGEARIAGFNGPRQTVVSGERQAVEAVMERAKSRGLPATLLSVSHAFHSPLVARAAPALLAHLDGEDMHGPRRPVASTVTGAVLDPAEDIRALLARQVTSPVRFSEAMAAASDGVDLWIEAGPGRVLTGLAADLTTAPILPLDAGGESLRGLLAAAGAAFALGAPLDAGRLFAQRFTRPFDLDWRPKFFVNPCETAPIPGCDSGGDSAPRDCAGEPAHPANSSAEVTQEPSDGPPDYDGCLATVRTLLAERTELPLEAVTEESRLLGDLHLNSITVGQIAVEAARRLRLAPPEAPMEYADATVGALARALEEAGRFGPGAGGGENSRTPAGIGSWTRCFTVQLAEQPPRAEAGAPTGVWQVVSEPGDPLADALRRRVSRGDSGGVIVCLPEEPDERHISLLLEGARTLLHCGSDRRFVLAQRGGGAASFARTLFMESADTTVCVVNAPPGHPRADITAEWVLSEAASASGFVEARYDSEGVRRVPVLRLLEPGDGSDESGESDEVEPLGPEDVLLVTGGGKGIAAECALDLARQNGVRLALLGRSKPEADGELAANLERMSSSGVLFRYVSADVVEGGAARAAIEEAERDLGPITALLHGAGMNVPQPLGALSEEAFRRTLAPKIDGLRNVLAALDPARLRLLVAFGSLIARTGMRGEADYAVANEWLARLVERWGAAHPACRCLTVEWSVWSGAGMGERLGRIDSLARAGIDPIPVNEGVAVLRRLLSRRLSRTARETFSTSVVVTGRFGDAPTLRLERPDLPLRRFLENTVVYYPRVELIADAEVSPGTDRYLEDHVLDGSPLFPAVMGLEAMAQAAMALVETDAIPVFENVRFNRPLIAPPYGTLTLRVAALVVGPGEVQVALRTRETGFQADHFRAVCRFAGANPREQRSARAGKPPHARPMASIDLDPSRDLYERILFQRGRFQRIRGYRQLRATECIAEISTEEAAEAAGWFSPYLPAGLVLGDPGARDATMHAIQACIPHATLLPTGIDRLSVYRNCSTGTRFAHATERSREGDDFTYDVDVTDESGVRTERWEGLRLRAVGERTLPSGLPPPLLAVHIERRAGALLPGSGMTVVVENSRAGRRSRSDRAMRLAAGGSAVIHHRPDGKPEIASGRPVSAAHAAGLTLAVCGPSPLGCDLEIVAHRSEDVWRDLLGPDRFALALLLARHGGEDLDTASTEIWAAVECLKKAGAAANAPLVLESNSGVGRTDAWHRLASGPLAVAVGIVRPCDGSDGSSVRDGSDGGGALACAIATAATAASAAQRADNAQL